MTSLRGQFLIASPYLEEEPFFRAVVLLVKHDDDESLGVIVNRPTDTTLSDLMPIDHFGSAVQELPAADRRILSGGPVDGPLFAVHDCPRLADWPVTGSLCFTASNQRLAQLLDEAAINRRFFHGYAGWGPGQLETELELGSWLLAPASAEDVFGDTDSLWNRCVQQVGREVLAKVLPERLAHGDADWN
jgi:putative transcriptional regulator